MLSVLRFMMVLCLVIVLLFSKLDGEVRSSCFALTVFLLSCDSQCSVDLPRFALGWSAVCDCGIS